MKKHALNDEIRRHFERIELDDARLAQLIKIRPTQQRFGFLTQPSFMTTGIAFFFVALLIFFFLPNERIEIRVAEEIALNHYKHLPLDFTTSDFDQLTQHMTKLDFHIANSSKVNLKSFKLMGARYCSIQGQIAAQIRLQGENGKIFTLYQTKQAVNLKELNDIRLELNGLKIRMWQDAGLFFSLAGPMGGF